MTALPVRPVDPRIKILGFRPVCWLRSMLCTPLTDSCLLDSTSPGWVHPFRGRVVYQLSWSTSLYCVNFKGCTRLINSTGTLPLRDKESGGSLWGQSLVFLVLV